MATHAIQSIEYGIDRRLVTSGRRVRCCNCQIKQQYAVARSSTIPAFTRRRPHSHTSGFTLIELLVVISIVALLISILLPALSRAREVSRQAVCATNLRSFGTALIQYSEDFSGWFPAKPSPTNASANVGELATVQHLASPNWGPNFAGMIRDIVERKFTRDGANYPQYLPESKVMLCPSDRGNNKPGEDALTEADLWPVESVDDYNRLPRTLGEQNNTRKSFISYFYVALFRSDDHGDFMIMADQSNKNDTALGSLTGLNNGDNHGTRGMNFLFIDSHVEWGKPRSGSFEDMQEFANRYWARVFLRKPRWLGGAGVNRSSEVQTVE